MAEVELAFRRRWESQGDWTQEGCLWVRWALRRALGIHSVGSSIASWIGFNCSFRSEFDSLLCDLGGCVL